MPLFSIVFRASSFVIPCRSGTSKEIWGKMSLVKGPQLTTWAVRSLAGEPISVVRVRNLQAVTKIPADAWGRPGKAQPLLISVEVSFREQFSQASTQDRLGADTVNYGTLSKAILKTLQDFKLEDWNLVEDDGHLGVVVKDIWASLTGQPFEFRNYSEDAKRGVLDIETLRFMAITVTLPKASLLGQGVSLSASSVFGSRDDSASLEGHSTMLKLHGLRVPTLVGVNPNERLAKQVIIADIELDKFHLDQDYYTFVEDVAVKVVTSFPPPKL